MVVTIANNLIIMYSAKGYGLIASYFRLLSHYLVNYFGLLDKNELLRYVTMLSYIREVIAQR